jgi:rhodanese-related sulfurtransferase
MKSNFRVVAVLFTGLLLLLILPSKAETNEIQDNIYKRFTATQSDSLVKANESNPDFVVLDVRTPSEWSNYHILGSINHSTGSATFDAELAALPKHKLYLLHCQSGSRSAGAFAKMKNLRFAEVYEMIDGITAWRNAGLPTTTVSGPKLMVASVAKSTKSAGNDTTFVTVTNRANGVLSFSNLLFTDSHAVQTNFDKLKTIAGAEDYSFFIIHPAGMGDSTHVSLTSNGGTITFAIGNSLSTNAFFNPLKEIKLYPNPVSERLFFDAGIATIEEITISDLTGKQVANLHPSGNIENIDVSALSNGIYMARIKSGERIITQKFVVKQ